MASSTLCGANNLKLMSEIGATGFRIRNSDFPVITDLERTLMAGFIIGIISHDWSEFCGMELNLI